MFPVVKMDRSNNKKQHVRYWAEDFDVHQDEIKSCHRHILIKEIEQIKEE
jgi:hypothetical protein